MVNGKRKGKTGELELKNELIEYGYEGARRTQQYCGEAGDADVVGLPGIHIECKRVESLNVYNAMRQAKGDAYATGDLPAVFHRKNRHKWLVTMELDDWMRIYEGTWQKAT
jgi:hypothetical protein